MLISHGALAKNTMRTKKAKQNKKNTRVGVFLSTSEDHTVQMYINRAGYYVWTIF